MNVSRGDVVQAVPLINGQMNVGAGTYTAKSVIHAETDAEITVNGESYTIPAGGDRAYEGDFTVVSGTVTYA